jgi:hypothetical protein
VSNSSRYQQINIGSISGVVLYTVQYNSIARISSIVHLRQNGENSSRSVHDTFNQERMCRTHLDIDKVGRIFGIVYNITALPADPRL